jgi:exopolysaccharide production protein ExoQ
MHPTLALAICLPAIIAIWRSAEAHRPQLTRGSWLALFWLLILCSRSVSYWLGISSSSAGAESNVEGNPFELTILLLQFVTAATIVYRRKVSWLSVLRDNPGITLFYIFLFVTVIWSPFPFATFKRCVKDIGALTIVLLILTEPLYFQAIKALLCRCAYVLFPLSIVFIKYFPELGRVYSNSGGTQITGVCFQKNTLGEIVLLFGLALVSDLTANSKENNGKPLRKVLIAKVGTLFMGLWLLYISDSKTATVCLLIGSFIILSPHVPIFSRSPKLLVASIFIGAPTLYLLDDALKISATLFELLGRDATLTNRTEIWAAIAELKPDIWLGSSFLSFWDIHNQILLGQYWVSLKTAHNGYLEIFLDGGILGLVFLGIMLIDVGRRATRMFLSGTDLGRLTFAVFLVMLIYNVSESMYARRSPLWFVFLLLSIEYARAHAYPNHQKSKVR